MSTISTHRAGGADPVRAVDRLVLDGRVPPAVEQEDVARELQVEPDAPRAVAHQQHGALRVVLEPIEHPVAPRVRDAAVVLLGLVPLGASLAEPRGDPLDRVDPLAEHDRLASRGDALLEVGLEPFELRAGSGRRVEVADLLQALSTSSKT